MKRAEVLPAIGVLAICLPCLVPLLIAAGISAGAFTAIGAWFSVNGLVLGAATIAALAVAVLGGIFFVRKPQAASCDSEVPQTTRTSEG